jgi:Holliday junction DNA helicase RuvA
VIASLTGSVQTTSLGSLVLEVQGVGYLVNVIPSLALDVKPGDSLFVHTSLVVREDAFTIFGFKSQDELRTFELLRSVTGVGPKSALSVLHHLGVSELEAAVSRGDDVAFKSVSGIGPKTAKLIIVTLSGKFATGAGANSENSDVISALTGLGYPQKVAEHAVAAAKKVNPSAATENLLRLALQELVKK